MVKIRLRRMGSTHRPFYRVVVSDSRNVPTSRAIEEIGFYNPLVTPKVIEIDRSRVDHWVANGAQVSPSVARLLKRAASAPAAAAEAPAKPTRQAGGRKPAASPPAAAPEAAPAADTSGAEATPA